MNKLILFFIATFTFCYNQSKGQITLNFIANPPACHGDSNGFAKVLVSGGTPPYTYSWSSGGTSDQEAGLTAGSYTVTVTDSLSSTATGSVTLNDPALLSYEIYGDPEVCLGETLVLSAVPSNFNGSTLPNPESLFYSWFTQFGYSNNSPSVVLPNAGMNMNGTFYLLVSNNNGCFSFDSINVVVNDVNSWTGVVDSLWSNVDNWTCDILPTAATNVVIPASAPFMPVVDTPGATAKNVSIHSGASLTFTGTGSVLNLKGDLQSNGNFSGVGGKLVLSGSGTQSIPGGNYDTIAVTGGGVKNPSGDIRIFGALQMESGHLQIGEHNISINSGASVSGASTAYVVTNDQGALTIDSVDGNTGAVVFPIGSSTGSYTPLQFANGGDRDNFSVRVADDVYDAYINDMPAGIAQASNAVDKTWYITEAVQGGSDATVSPIWNEADELPGFDRDAAYVSHYNGQTNAWMPGEAGAATGSGPYSHSMYNVSSFSPFGVGSAGSPLDMNLIQFAGRYEGQIAVLTWKTEDEDELSFYDVERSADGRSFRAIARVTKNGAGVYEVSDKDAAKQPAKHIYYRLAVHDLEGGRSYSRVIGLTTDEGSAGDVSISPNPVQGGQLHLHVPAKQGKMNMKIRDVQGRVLRDATFASDSGRISIDINELPAGMYTVEVEFADGRAEYLKFSK